METRPDSCLGRKPAWKQTKQAGRQSKKEVLTLLASLPFIPASWLGGGGGAGITVEGSCCRQLTLSLMALAQGTVQDSTVK